MPDSTEGEVLSITSLAEFVSLQSTIVGRINAYPNGGRLLLSDPLRCLQDVGVALTPEAARAFGDAIGQDLVAESPLRHLYDSFKRDQPDPSMTITINGILPGYHHA